ncbi:MAG: hypothetical protein NW237_12085 [Cyanobacteriota bacterium]|nr:hypothetical protein [Cyanobacteriota bacterium]
MTGVEKILESEFRQIMNADLHACSNAYEIMLEYVQLRRRRVWLFVYALLVCIVISLATIVLYQYSANQLLVGAALVGVGITLLILLRQNTRLQRSLNATRTRWEEAHLQKCDVFLMRFITEIARKVINYNALVNRLEELQTGDYWRDFRQLTDAEKAYISSIFTQVRGQLLSALQACRQIVDHPETKVGHMLSSQLVSRDKELVQEFTAKTMTSNQYLSLAKDLTAMESELQVQIKTLAAR